GHLTVNGSVALVVGQSTTYTATLYDAQNRVVAGAPITWTSSNPAVAAVLPNGVVQALSTGSITISATSVGLTSFLALTVSAPAASSLSLDYSQDLVTGFWNYSADLALGDTYLIGARLYGPQNQRLTSLAGLTWQSDRPDIASVGPDGLVTAAATGVAVITARYGALTRDFTIRVGAFGSGNAVIRLMHGTGEAGPITFQARNGPLATLNFGESTELTVPAKSIQMVLSGVSGNPIYSAAPFDAFNGYLAPAQHYTIFSGGTTTYTPTILALLDHHDPVAADQSLIRLVMVGSYAANYYGNNIYFVDPGASIAGGGLVACYFDAPTAIGYYTRPPVPFDIVIADAGFFSAATSITTPDVEAARFQVTPVAGRATTYVITGSSRATLRITALVDP
ncbi:MAG: Ig-like domain-containing protein, partial [Gemmatimonadota bacterium]